MKNGGFDIVPVLSVRTARLTLFPVILTVEVSTSQLELEELGLKRVRQVGFERSSISVC